jgi:hypothetical protein
MNMFDTNSIIQRDPLTTLSKDRGWGCWPGRMSDHMGIRLRMGGSVGILILASEKSKGQLSIDLLEFRGNL